MAKCPKCGSERFEYKLRSDGMAGNVRYYRTTHRNTRSWVIPAGRKHINVEKTNRVVGFCPDCGYVEEKNAGLGILALLMVAIIAFTVFRNVSSNNKKDFAPSDNQYIWAHEYSPISDFEYIINGDTLELKKYTGDDYAVYVGSEYRVNGKTMPITEIGALFDHSDSVYSVIIADGTTDMLFSIFNSSNVRCIYLPSSLERLECIQYTRNIERLYYGGSRELFESKYHSSITEHVSKEVQYDVSIQSLIDTDIRTRRQ